MKKRTTVGIIILSVWFAVALVVGLCFGDQLFCGISNSCFGGYTSEDYIQQKDDYLCQDFYVEQNDLKSVSFRPVFDGSLEGKIQISITDIANGKYSLKKAVETSEFVSKKEYTLLLGDGWSNVSGDMMTIRFSVDGEDLSTQLHFIAVDGKSTRYLLNPSYKFVTASIASSHPNLSGVAPNANRLALKLNPQNMLPENIYWAVVLFVGFVFAILFFLPYIKRRLLTKQGKLWKKIVAGIFALIWLLACVSTAFSYKPYSFASRTNDVGGELPYNNDASFADIAPVDVNKIPTWFKQGNLSVLGKAIRWEEVKKIIPDAQLHYNEGTYYTMIPLTDGGWFAATFQNELMAYGQVIKHRPASEQSFLHLVRKGTPKFLVKLLDQNAMIFDDGSSTHFLADGSSCLIHYQKGVVQSIYYQWDGVSHFNEFLSKDKKLL